MTNTSAEKQTSLDWIETNRQWMSDFHLEIWDYAETAWREYKSAKAYVDLLRKEGFTVEEGSGEMPTAFVATWGEGRPVLGTYAEFDERTGGGIGGSKWVAPLLPKDFAPPVDLRWPEYVQTARGEEWWLPTPQARSG